MIKTEAKTEVTTNWDKDHMNVRLDYFSDEDDAENDLLTVDYDNLEESANDLKCSAQLLKMLLDYTLQINENLALLNKDAKEIVETIVNKEK
jgi:hypothetical protein